MSDTANQLVDRLTDEIAKWEIRYGRRKRGRRSGADKLRAAVTGLLGDLLLARKPSEKANGWVYRSMQAQSFTGKRVSYRTFAAIVDALKDLDLVEHRPPVNFWGSVSTWQTERPPPLCGAVPCERKATQALSRVRYHRHERRRSFH